jgi:hypothetical protein
VQGLDAACEGRVAQYEDQIQRLMAEAQQDVGTLSSKQPCHVRRQYQFLTGA